MKILIVSGGSLDIEWASGLLERERFDRVIAADSGLAGCDRLGIIPTDILGDFDSLKDPGLLERYGSMTRGPVRHYPERKDFTDTDLAMQIHIMGGCGADLGYRALAMNSIEFTYHGVSSHAAGAPERGVNALDACYLTFNGINALRQHITSDARIHGIVCDGGLAPNVVPALTRSRFYIRAEKREYVDELEQKVLHCAEGACLMTGASYEWRYFENSFDNYEGIPFLSDVFEEALQNAGVTGIRKAPRPYSGSTDVGNVSRVCPTAYCELGAGNTDGTNVHEEAFLPYVDGVNASESLKQAVLAQAILAADFCSDPAKQEELYRLRDTLRSRR